MRLENDFYTVQSLQEEVGTVNATFCINSAHALFAGHFPGRPVVPGVCEMQLVKELLEHATARPLQLSEAAHVKFLQFINPQTAGALQAVITYTREAEHLLFNACIKDHTVDYFKMKGVFIMENGEWRMENDADATVALRAHSPFSILHSPFKIIVIIPTYNNAATLRSVIDRVKAQGYPVLVVNDGSTDYTADVLSNCTGIHVISYTDNRGKGFALQTGFREAIARGFDYAITIDSDGQHNPGNIPRFVEKLEAMGESMVLGERNMTHHGVPMKSNFGRRFSNFWFYVDTWTKSRDTQTGFRLYPLRVVGKQRYYTRRFEFEIESLVRIAWENVPVVDVPVDVAYFSGSERVSHFRPFKDFVRISALNTVLFFAAYCFFLPRLVFKKWRQKGFREVFFNPFESNERKALSIALGVFWGIIPIWGFQMAVALSSATALKLNKVLALIASNVSIPPAVPFIVFASMWLGKIALGTDTMVPFSYDLTPMSVMFAVLQYVVGSIILGLLGGSVAFAVSYLVLKLTRKPRVR